MSRPGFEPNMIPECASRMVLNYVPHHEDVMHGGVEICFLILILGGGVKSRDRAVGIATGYGLDDRAVRVRVLVVARMFSSPRRPDRLWSTGTLFRG
jgi:hypothetical protein